MDKLFLIVLVIFVVIIIVNSKFRKKVFRAIKSLFGKRTKPADNSQRVWNGESINVDNKYADSNDLVEQLKSLNNEISIISNQLDKSLTQQKLINENLVSCFKELNRSMSVLCACVKQSGQVAQDTVDWHQSNEMPRHRLAASMYAYDPSSINPYGFKLSDLTEFKDENSVFLISDITDYKATFQLIQESEVIRKVITNLQYYTRIINYTKTSDSNSRGVRLTANGSLRRVGEVWVIDDKIELEIIN